MFTSAEVKSNNFWWNMVVLFLLVFFIDMILFFMVLQALSLLDSQLLPLFHVLSSNCNLWLLAKLREIDKAYLTKALKVAILLRARNQLPLIDKLLKILGLRKAWLNVLMAWFPLPLRWLGILLHLIHLFSPSLFQHELLELVDDEVLANSSDSVLAVLLGVDPDYACWLLTLLTVAFLVVENTLRHVLEKSLSIPASSSYEATLRNLLILLLKLRLTRQSSILLLFFRLIVRIVGRIFTHSLQTRVLFS